MFSDLKKTGRFLKDVATEVQEKDFLSGLRMGLSTLRTGLSALPLKLAPVVGFVLLPIFAVFKIKVLNTAMTAIGHLCLETDCYVKEERLGEHPHYRALILARPRRRNVANEHMLSYWESYVKVVRSPVLCSLLKPLLRNRLTCLCLSGKGV